jgi:hypothetical protein
MAAKPKPTPKAKPKGLNDFLKDGKRPPSKNKKLPSDADVIIKGYNDKKTVTKSAKKLASRTTSTPKPKVTPKPKKTTKPKLWGAGDPDYLKKMKEQSKKERLAREKQQQGFVIE